MKLVSGAGVLFMPWIIWRKRRDFEDKLDNPENPGGQLVNGMGIARIALHNTDYSSVEGCGWVE